MTRLVLIEGIEPQQVKLNKLGIMTMEDYLDACKTKKDRTELAKKLKVDEDMILTWANHADLARVHGVAGLYGKLLEEAGVDTIPELANRNPENLYIKLVQVNEETGIVKKLPSQTQVSDWVAQAKALPRKLEY